LCALAYSNPIANIYFFGLMAVAVAFFSSAQDVVIDAYRREILEERELGLGTSLAIGGYRVGMLVSSGAALALSDLISWTYVYLIMAGCVAAGSITVLFAPEPKVYRTPKSLQEAFIDPFTDFFKRNGAVLILVF